MASPLSALSSPTRPHLCRTLGPTILLAYVALQFALVLLRLRLVSALVFAGRGLFVCMHAYLAPLHPSRVPELRVLTLPSQ